MKIDLTYKEANLLNAILWELGEEEGVVHSQGVWKLGTKGIDACRAMAEKLEDANAEVNAAKGKDRDLSGAPKGTILDARWTA